MFATFVCEFPGALRVPQSGRMSRPRGEQQRTGSCAPGPALDTIVLDVCAPPVVDVVDLLTERWFGKQPDTDAGNIPVAPGTPAADLRPIRARSSRQVRFNPAASSRQESASGDGAALTSEALAIQGLPGIGTWAGRQRLFYGPHKRPSPAAASPAAPRRESPGMPEGERDGAFSSRELLEEQQAEHAWRWRFSRKWEVEQRRSIEKPDGSGQAEAADDVLEPITYCKACGTGVDLQVTASLRRAAGEGAGGSREAPRRCPSRASLCQFDCDGSCSSSAANNLLGASLAAREAPTLWRSPSWTSQQPSATKDLLSLAARARSLMHLQAQIESDAQARWESCGGGEAWVGASVAAVQIDRWGRFPYLVFRLTEGRRQRLLVRGSNSSGAEALAREVEEQVAAAFSGRSHGRPRVQLAGGGIMEWRQDTERHLRLLPPSLDEFAGCSPPSPTATHTQPARVLTALAAALVRQALPCHFLVTTGNDDSRGGDRQQGLGSGSERRWSALSAAH